MGFFVHESAVVDAGAKIEEGASVWHFTHVCRGAVVGAGTKIGQNCYIDRDVVLGRNVKIQNNVSVYRGVVVEDHVFLGPSCVLTNVITPRSAFPRNDPGADYQPTVLRVGASIGANATLRCGIELGAWCLVGSGAVVTKDVLAHQVVVGVPAKPAGWACMCGEILNAHQDTWVCKSPRCGRKYVERRLDGHIQIFLDHTPQGAVAPVVVEASRPRH